MKWTGKFVNLSDEVKQSLQSKALLFVESWTHWYHIVQNRVLQ